MFSLKFRLLNQFGASEILASPNEIEVYFPYESSDALMKRMSRGDVRILNDVKGEFEVDVSDFELQGMPIGEKQNISVKVISTGKTRHAIFQKCLNVRAVDVDGSLRKVVER